MGAFTEPPAAARDNHRGAMCPSMAAMTAACGVLVIAARRGFVVE